MGIDPISECPVMTRPPSAIDRTRPTDSAAERRADESRRRVPESHLVEEFDQRASRFGDIRAGAEHLVQVFQWWGRCRLGATCHFECVEKIEIERRLAESS